MNKGLEEVWGTETKARVADQKNLGYFQDANNVVSVLMAMNLEMNGRTTPLIGSTSFLLVNKRLIFLYMFKRTSAKEDAETMIDLTKKWTAAVLAANKQ